MQSDRGSTHQQLLATAVPDRRIRNPDRQITDRITIEICNLHIRPAKGHIIGRRVRTDCLHIIGGYCLEG